MKRNNLTDELMNFDQIPFSPTKRLSTNLKINYEQILEKQSFLIQNLHKQCLMLRHKIHRIKSEEKFSSQNKSISDKNINEFAQAIESQILKEIGQLLEIQVQQISKQKIIQTIKRLKWDKQQNSQPIFIERIKQLRIPIAIETIIQKPIIVEKQVIKYIQKIVEKIVQKTIIQQKIVEVPVFRQKIIEKYVPKFQELNQVQNSKIESSNSTEEEENSKLKEGSNRLPSQIMSQKGRKSSNDHKNHNKNQQNFVFYRPEMKKKKNSIDFGKNIQRQLENSQFPSNQMHYGDRKYEKTSYSNQMNKTSFKSSKYSDNYRKGSNDEEEYNSKFYKPSNRYQDNRNINSTKYIEKQKIDRSYYNFDKNKYMECKTTEQLNKNIRKRDKNDYYERYH